MSISSTVLFLMDLCLTYPVWNLMAYLMDVWNVSLVNAAAITNIVDCLMNILPFALKILFTRTSIGMFPVLMITMVAFTIGTGLLWMSTPPVTGKCSKYKPECLGITQHILFSISLVVIVIGGAGFSVVYPVYKWTKIYKHSYFYHRLKCCDGCVLWVKVIYCCLIWLIGGGAILAAMWSKTWCLKFGIPAAVTLVFGLFLLVYLYRNRESIDVKFVLPLLKFTKRKARDCLFKILISITFLVCGIVSSIGNTYFLEQANLMNRKLGPIVIPDQILQIFCKLSKIAYKYIHQGLGYGLSRLGLKRHSFTFSIVMSMILAGTCCAVAAITEKKRLNLVNQHGLVINKPEVTFPLKMFAMIPQLLILGALDGLLDSKLFTFDHEGSHKLVQVDSVAGNLRLGCEQIIEMAEYRKEFASTIRGLGIIGGTILVYVLGQVSKRKGQPSWFQDTLNKSRLDKYYWFLAALCVLNLALYLLVVLCMQFIKLLLHKEESPTETNNNEINTSIP